MLLTTNNTILSGGISEPTPNWTKRGKILNEMLLRLYIPLKENASLMVGEEYFTLTEGNIYLINGNKINDQICEDQFHHLWLHFTPESLYLRSILLWEFNIQEWKISDICHTNEILSEIIKLEAYRTKLLEQNSAKPVCRSIFLASDTFHLKLQGYISYLIGDAIERSNVSLSGQTKTILDEITPAIKHMDSNYTNGFKLHQ